MRPKPTHTNMVASAAIPMGTKTQLRREKAPRRDGRAPLRRPGPARHPRRQRGRRRRGFRDERLQKARPRARRARSFLLTEPTMPEQKYSEKDWDEVRTAFASSIMVDTPISSL